MDVRTAKLWLETCSNSNNIGNGLLKLLYYGEKQTFSSIKDLNGTTDLLALSCNLELIRLFIHQQQQQLKTKTEN